MIIKDLTLIMHLYDPLSHEKLELKVDIAKIKVKDKQG